jgi:hypothetical protein
LNLSVIQRVVLARQNFPRRQRRRSAPQTGDDLAMVNEINGLPAHVLLVHAVVILIPLAALMTILSAVWPAARRRMGIFTPLVALVALILVPVATNAGEWLQARVANTELVRTHAELGDTMLWFAIGLFVAALLAWGVPTLITRRSQQAPPPWVGVVVAVIAVVLVGASVVQVVRVGEAGSQAVWSGTVCPEPVNADGSCPAA